MSYIIKNEHGAFCSVCQSHLSIEEEDWDTCDACGGDGIGDDDEFDYDADHAMQMEAAELSAQKVR